MNSPVCEISTFLDPLYHTVTDTPVSILAHGAACIYACTPTEDKASEEIASSLATSYPNTKVIPYPLHASDEQSTLSLIDDVLNAFGRLDVWVCSSGLLGPPSIDLTTPFDLQKCFEANSLAPFFALKYAPPAMRKLCSRGNYPNASEKDRQYGSIIVVGSVASTYGGCWGPCFTMSSHAALGVVRAGVTVLKGKARIFPFLFNSMSDHSSLGAGTGVRINCISPGQIDVGVDLASADVRGMKSQFPPATTQSLESQKNAIGLERAGLPMEVARVAGFLASGFSSYMTGANTVVDGGASIMSPLIVPV